MLHNHSSKLQRENTSMGLINSIKCYTELILLYAFETWTIDRLAEKYVMKWEMWFLRTI